MLWGASPAGAGVVAPLFRMALPARSRWGQSLAVLAVAWMRGVFVGRDDRRRAVFFVDAGGLRAVGFAPPGYWRIPHRTRFLPVVGGSWGPHCPWLWGASPAGAGVVAPLCRMALLAGSQGGQSLAVLPVARTRGVFVGRGGGGWAAFCAAAVGLLVAGFAPPGYGRVPFGTRFLPVAGGSWWPRSRRHCGPLTFGSVRPTAAASQDGCGHRRDCRRGRCRFLRCHPRHYATAGASSSLWDLPRSP